MIASLVRAVLALLVLAVLWLAGLYWFVDDWRRPVPEPTQQAGAIVVLTGGAERINAGLRLLAAGRAPRLLISGVHPTTGLADLLTAAGYAERLADWRQQISLDHVATDTASNATQALAWLRAEGIESIFLVTSHYHLRRAVLEFHQGNPQLRIIPYPVVPPVLHQPDAWQQPAVLGLVIAEYHKTVLALLRYVVRQGILAA